MKRTLSILLTATLATIAFLPGMQAQAPDGTTEVQLYLNRGSDGSLALSTNAPSARNATTWATSGTYHTSQGLSLEIRLQDPNPNWTIDESVRPEGWINYAFKQVRGSSLYPLSNHYGGSFSWLLVEGERSSTMAQECAKWNATQSRRCDSYRYAADYPGHAASGTAHTHGDGSDPNRGLLSGDLEWVLKYTIPPCNSSSSLSLCGVSGSTMRYEFSVRIDGTAFLQYVAQNQQPVIPQGEDGNETIDNETAPEPAEPQDPNATGSGNQSASSAQGTMYRPQAYTPEGADGTAPGAGIALFLATLGIALARRRRA